jgi:Ca2+-binding EF-hand superfamily protein
VVTPDVPVSDLITSNDIYQFLRENKRYYVSEDDCKFIIKYYDSDNDGCINYVE